MNKDSYLVLDTLPAEYDARVKAMEVDEKPTEDYSDIGGLDKQIQARRERDEACERDGDPPRAGEKNASLPSVFHSRAGPCQLQPRRKPGHTRTQD